MEQSLYKAAMKGSVESLQAIIRDDGQILDKIMLGYFNGSPLHVAASQGHLLFVKELLLHNPELAEVLDLEYRSALHFATAKGHIDIVKELVRVNPEMCLACDRNGRNPLHIAAMNGNNEVLKELVQANPYAALVMVKGETILHLCVKHNQLETLKLLNEILQDPVNCKDDRGDTILHLVVLADIVQELVNCKDGSGNTILHLAVLAKNLPIIRCVLKNRKVDVNAINTNGHTVMDILARTGTQPDDLHLTIEDFLLQAKAKRAKDLIHGEWLTKKREALLVVASLIATMAFQAGASPPAGVWQDNPNVSRVEANPPASVWEDNSGIHRAGEAIMAYNYPDSYPYFLRFNTIGFIMSLSTILLLISGLPFRKRVFMWVLVLIMWLTITSMAVTYAYAIVVVTPKKDRKSLSNTVKVGVIAWCSVMAALLIAHTIRLIKNLANEKRSRDKAIKKIFRHQADAKAHAISANISQTNV